MSEMTYEEMLAREQREYAQRVCVHDLPGVYHYWSNTYLRPQYERLGLKGDCVLDSFVQPIAHVARREKRTVTVASLGAGNCDFEAQVLSALAKRDIRNVELHCMDINPDMLERGREHGRRLGIEKQMVFVQNDINRDGVGESYDVVMANQSLHHFVELERIFDDVRTRLRPGGYFVASDMIGRNGHMLWPEAYEVVCDVWKLLPHKYKYNHLLQRYEDPYENWDCSNEGFEGIRAQDILPLLVQSFRFEMFLGFANIVDTFVGRCFGHNYSEADPFDKSFVDLVARLDERHLATGLFKPTHLVAWMTVDQPARELRLDNQTPEGSVRPLGW